MRAAFSPKSGYGPEITVTVTGQLIVDVEKLAQTPEFQQQVEALRRFAQGSKSSAAGQKTLPGD